MFKCDFYRVRYLPSDGAVAKVVLRDIDLNVQGDKFEVANISETVKMHRTTLPDVDSSRRTAPL